MKPPAAVVAKYAFYGHADVSQLSWVLRQFPQYRRAPLDGPGAPRPGPERVAADCLEVAALMTRNNVASYARAWEHFRGETLLCHLQAEPSRPAAAAGASGGGEQPEGRGRAALGLAVTLVGQAGEERTVRLDEQAFYVQRKVALLSDTLDALVRERQGHGAAGRAQEPERVLDLWIDCQERFWARGFYDSDVMDPGANYGVLLDSDGRVERVVCVDVGELHHSNEEEGQEEQERQLREGAGGVPPRRDRCGEGGGLVAELVEKRVIEPRQYFARHLAELGLYDYFCEQVHVRYDAFRNGMLAACFARPR
jgi:hypothetical protein